MYNVQAGSHKLTRFQQEQSKKATAGDAFEDVLYGSESELGDSDDEDDLLDRPRASPGLASPAHTVGPKIVVTSS